MPLRKRKEIQELLRKKRIGITGCPDKIFIRVLLDRRKDQEERNMVLLEEIKSAIPQEKAKLLEIGEYL